MQSIKIRENSNINKSLLNGFPQDLKLCYENVIHKKVYNSELFLAIPEGKKCILWFTTNNKGYNTCYLLDINDEREITYIKPINLCFNSELSYQTILYGSYFFYENTRMITVEDIMYYKGINLVTTHFYNKINYLQKMFMNDVSQIAYNNNFSILGLPIMTHNFDELLIEISKLPYKIKYIQLRYESKKHYDNLMYVKPSVNFKPNNYNNTSNYNNNTNRYGNNQVKKELIFKIKAELQNDIYNLYVYNNGVTDYFYDVALIPDYKTSVMMNSLFRNIKENRNLDALEESDSEDEFENDNIDKFVDLEKSYNMLCEYNVKFNKWVPVKVVARNERLANLKYDFQ